MGYKSINPTFERIIRSGHYVVLDTETTGIGDDAEIVSIAIVTADGQALLDTLVKPVNPIPPTSTKVHCITDSDVADCPTWAEIQPLVAEFIAGKVVIAYNAQFDCKMLSSSDAAAGLPVYDYKAIARFGCAMKWYAELYGDWNDYREDWRWQKLTDAMKQNALPVIDAHHALGDVLMTISLLKKLIAEIDKNENETDENKGIEQ
jgi:DNA polymerase-3 subunit epsilon